MSLVFLMYAFVTACSFLKSRSPIVESLSQQGNQIVIERKANVQGYYQLCDYELVKVFAIEGEQRIKLSLSPQEVAEHIWDYYVDGEFLYPEGNEGCDMVICTQVEEKTSVELKSYHREEDKAPPADYLDVAKRNHVLRDLAPESVRSVISKPITGTVEIQFSTYTNKNCSGTKRVETHRITIK